MLAFRPAWRQDEAALYAICLATGDGGADAAHLYRDGRMVGHIYAAPYLALCLEAAFVAEDGAGVCGYIVGALDTVRYEERLERDWWPRLRGLYADPQGDDAAQTREAQIREDWTPDQRRSHFIHHPSRTPAALTDAYPAHIHMNLLPRTQGKGGGSRLLSLWLAMARAHGVRGVHLGTDARNQRGMTFWRSRGFEPLAFPESGEGVWFGMDLQP